MGAKVKIAGWITVGVLTGALATMQLQAVARGSIAPLPLEELQCSASSRATMSSRSTRRS